MHLFYFLLSLSLSFPAFAGWSIASCNSSQKAALDRTSTEAFTCLERAKDKIEKDFEKLKQEAHWTGSPKSYFQVLFVNGNKEFYLGLINKALADNKANGVRYQCDNRCPEDRIAYTKFNFGKPVKPNYFCTAFFQKPEWVIVTHEFGRLYASIEGDSNLDKSNIYVWDRIMDVLCQP